MCTMGSADSQRSALQRTGAQQFPRVAPPSLSTAMAAPVSAPCPARSAHRVYNVEPPRLRNAVSVSVTTAIASTTSATAVAAVCLPACLALFTMKSSQHHAERCRRAGVRIALVVRVFPCPSEMLSGAAAPVPPVNTQCAIIVTVL